MVRAVLRRGSPLNARPLTLVAGGALAVAATIFYGRLRPLFADVIPPGERLIPEGRFTRGRTGSDRSDEGPPHDVKIHAFYMDTTLVTRGQFARFVAATGYKTSAEQMGFGMEAWDGLADWEWRSVRGASWRQPLPSGTPGAEAFLRDDAPVVLVSFADADAFCSHEGKRLPTEAEWEYAMRAGSVTRFPWGDSPRRDDGAYMLNFFQGASHRKNRVEDGYLYVSPVRAFPPNRWGIYDPVGNVWQWTADRYASDTYARLAAQETVVDPRGPNEGVERVVRGGSWWCGVCTCEGYGLLFRGKANPSAPFNNNGFRCAKDATR
jgi:sulfatase modifying factor 1